VSGMGKGIGAELLVGAHQALGRPNSGNLASRLRLFPFPYWHADEAKRLESFRINRTEMAAQAGAAIFISGNKLHAGGIIESPGVMAEFAEAKRNQHIIVPVGASGHAAKRIWEEVISDQKTFFPGLNVTAELTVLGDTTASTDQLLGAIMAILKRSREGLASR
jgi:hypothetical protein